MAFSAVFPRVMRPAFGPGLAAATAPSGWWLSGGITAANCLAAYTPKGAASLAASYDNNAAPGNGLADGTYDAAPGVAPTFNAATGWAFVAASTQYLTTGYTPTNDSHTYIARFANAAASAGALFGILDGGKRVYILPFQAGVGVAYSQHNTAVTVSPDLANGVLAVTGTDAYRNGVDDGDIGDWTTGNVYSIYIGAIHRSASITNYFSGEIQALAIYNTTLTAPQVLAVSTAMAAL